MDNDNSKYRPHETCASAGYCVDLYTGFVSAPCKLDRFGFRLPGVIAPPSETHAYCATSGFCTVHYAGFTKEPCRSVAL